MDNFKDELNAQTDKRHIEKLVEQGEITLSELANAPIVEVIPICKCNQGLEPVGTILRCPKCYQQGEEISNE